jgi:DNA-binding XRE family transcriptional regulator
MFPHAAVAAANASAKIIELALIIIFSFSLHLIALEAPDYMAATSRMSIYCM